MNEFFGSIWWLLVTLGLLVTFHEYGHFVVARRLGVKVLRFSVGFGRTLWSRTARDGTEYVVAAIPLGGYVKFLDEREGEVAPEDAPRAFNRQPVGARFAIVAAGPVFNLVFALAAFWAMFVVGKPDYLPIVGRADGVAQSAGFERGDLITAIGGQPVATWTDASLFLAKAAIDRKPIDVAVNDAQGTERTRRLRMEGLADDAETRGIRAIGLYPKQFLLDAVVGKVSPDGPAQRAGLLAGDRLLAVDGEPVASWDELPPRIDGRGRSGGALELEVARGESRLDFRIVPERRTLDGVSRYVIGIEPQAQTATYDALLRYGPVDAIGAAFGETWRMTRETLALLKRMVLGQASLKNISGPISIAQFANASAQLGVAWFLFFLAVLSLSIAIMNLLPIPILDGGHLVYYLIEVVKGRPVTERTVAAGQYVGLALLATLMGLAFYNDILRLIS